MHRLHPYAAHGRREPAALLDDLADEGEPVGVYPGPGRIPGRARQGPGDLRRPNHIADRRHLGGRQAAHVLGDPPQLLVREELLLEQIAERRHRRAVEPGAQAMIDVLDCAATVEAPILAQVRGEDWPAGVVLQRGRRGPVAAALVAVALAAPDRVVELSPDTNGVGAATRRLAEIEQLWTLSGVGEVRAERLDIRHDLTALAIGEPSLPGRHRGTGQPLIDSAQQVAVGRELTAGRAAYRIQGVAR